MSALNETADELFERLSNEAGPKMKVSLNNLKVACDDIQRAKGTMSYTRVADVATEKFGGPKRQSVQNNQLLKSYVAARSCEYSDKLFIRSSTSDSGKESLKEKRYPAGELDMKMRVHIAHLEDHIRRLELENQHISKLLKQKTRENPVSLKDVLTEGPDPEGNLQMEIPKVLPDSVRKLVSVLLGRDVEMGNIQQISVRRSREAGEVICTDHGIERHIIVKRQWTEIDNWLTNPTS